VLVVSSLELDGRRFRRNIAFVADPNDDQAATVVGHGGDVAGELAFRLVVRAVALLFEVRVGFLPDLVVDQPAEARLFELLDGAAQDDDKTQRPPGGERSGHRSTVAISVPKYTVLTWALTPTRADRSPRSSPVRENPAVAGLFLVWAVLGSNQ
jgi:hypothetical protein